MPLTFEFESSCYYAGGPGEAGGAGQAVQDPTGRFRTLVGCPGFVCQVCMKTSIVIYLCVCTIDWMGERGLKEEALDDLP